MSVNCSMLVQYGGTAKSMMHGGAVGTQSTITLTMGEFITSVDLGFNPRSWAICYLVFYTPTRTLGPYSGGGRCNATTTVTFEHGLAYVTGSSSTASINQLAFYYYGNYSFVDLTQGH